MGMNAFFFRKEPVEGIAFFRILFSLMLIANSILLFPHLQEFFGPRGMVEAASPANLASLNVFYFFPVTQVSVYAVFAVHALAACLLLLGLFTRTSAFLAYLTMISFHQLNYLILNSGDTAMKLVLFLLVFSRSGEAFSLDRLIRLRKGLVSGPPRMQAPWVQRLLQLQVAFLYFSTAYLKFDGEGWANGNALYYTSRLWDFERFPLPYVFDHLWSMRVMTWISLFLEGALGTLIWYRPFRVPLVVIGILFHLGIEYTMNIPVFEWVMMSLLVAMLEPRDAYAFCRRLEARLKGRARPVTVA
jgi:uncharacterized membrane protein YphA (DoxX/SURF4 family)